MKYSLPDRFRAQYETQSPKAAIGLETLSKNHDMLRDLRGAIA